MIFIINQKFTMQKRFSMMKISVFDKSFLKMEKGEK